MLRIYRCHLAARKQIAPRYARTIVKSRVALSVRLHAGSCREKLQFWLLNPFGTKFRYHAENNRHA